ncbi:MAG: POT family proton-dependent oligopeptide transporter, partial [Oceanospirillaceae bacterium]
GMLAGLVVFWHGVGNNVYGDQGHQPKEWSEKKIAGMNIRVPVWVLSFAAVPVFAYLVQNNSTKILASVFEDMGLLQFLLFTLLALVILYIIFISIFKLSREEVSKLVVVCVLTLFITVFWSFFEQSGSALTNFAEQNVNLIGLNASQTNSINPFWIMVLAVPFSLMWKALDKKGLNPNTPVKFALGIAQLGVGFLVFSLAAGSADDNGMVPMMFLVIGYLLLTTGELFVSPIGLSKVTELSPGWLTAFMMGVWFLSSSFAHFIAGIISKMTISDNGADGWIQTTAKGITGMDAAALEGATEGMVNLANYTNVFAQIGIISLIISVLALAVSPVLKKMMHEIH